MLGEKQEAGELELWYKETPCESGSDSTLKELLDSRR
jgi:hypothetical protein